MKVDLSQVAYVAELAHLELTPQERERIVRDLNSILEHIDTLNELDTDGVEPLTASPILPPLAGGPEPDTQPLREDKSRPSLSHQEAISNAPLHSPDFFRVPRVIEK